MPAPLDCRDIARVLGVSDRAIRLQATQQGWPFIEKPGRGGRRRLYALDALPEDIRVRLTLHQARSEAATQAAGSASRPVATADIAAAESATRWAWFDRQPDSVKDEGFRLAGICMQVRRLLDQGVKATQAIAQVAEAAGEPVGTVKRWWYGQAGKPGARDVAPADYAPVLAPVRVGRSRSEVPEELWQVIKADYLRPEQPALLACYRRAAAVAAERGWPVPSYHTIQRRVREIHWSVVTLMREGPEALQRKSPHVTRERAHLVALEAVNADGHLFDLRVTLPSGKEGRAHLVAWQDVYSGKFLSWRLCETLTSDAVRLSFGALIEQFGVPRVAYFDNGREFANKLLTGGAPNRFRFKHLPDDPIGLLSTMGVEVRFTLPYHGQSKPIERAFRDLCESIAKHPAASGAYTGNSPLAKPANYGARCLTWAELAELVRAGINEHNARVGRRGGVCAGRSFDQTFQDSYQQIQVRKPTAEQRRLWLLAPQRVTVRQNGHVAVAGNLYWHQDLPALVGQHVVARFDPDDLARPVAVYRMDGRFVCDAERTVARFNDTEAARQVAKATADLRNSARQMANAEVRLDVATVAALQPTQPEPELPTPGAVELMRGPARSKPAQADEAPKATGTDGYVSLVDQMVMRQMASRQRPRLVDD